MTESTTAASTVPPLRIDPTYFVPVDPMEELGCESCQ